ncbi:MAG TPA: S24 family peptidase [Fimbriimonas sp.]|nr:S24 family peptidase [Fimbriimonas sp.]
MASETPETIELNSIMEKLGYNLRRFAHELGEPEARYKNYHYGITKKVPDRVMEKARSLVRNKVVGYDGHKVSLLFGEMAKLPVVGRTGAGEGATNVDIQGEEIWVPMSLQRIGGIGYVIDGESMMPALQQGDVALFREMRQPRNGHTFLLSKENHYLCKNIGWNGKTWVMESLNPDKERYPDQPLDDWQILGMLVGWYRSVGSYEKLEADPNGLRLDGIV